MSQCKAELRDDTSIVPSARDKGGCFELRPRTSLPAGSIKYVRTGLCRWWRWPPVQVRRYVKLS